MSARLILGTVQFGMDYGISNERGVIPQEEIEEILSLAAESDIRTLDTAVSYGYSQRILGELTSKLGCKFEIITKLPQMIDQEEVSSCINRSLEDLKVDHLYGCLVHHFDFYRTHPEILQPLQNLRRSDLIQKIGFSLYHTTDLDYLLEHKVDFDLVQLPYNIFDQRFEPYFRQLKDEGKEIHVRSVFLQGLFFMPPGKMDPFFAPIKDEIMRVREIGENNRIPLNLLLLNFARINPDIDGLIFGIADKANFFDNLKGEHYLPTVKKLYPQLRKFSQSDENWLLPINWP